MSCETHPLLDHCLHLGDLLSLAPNSARLTTFSCSFCFSFSAASKITAFTEGQAAEEWGHLLAVLGVTRM